MPNTRHICDTLVRPFRDFLFPPLCLVCNALLEPREERMCGSCMASIRPVLPSDCQYQETKSKLVSDGTISGLVAVYYFETGGPLQTVIHQLKYSGMTSLGLLLGKHLGGRMKEELAGKKITGIVPVPLHRLKRRERGYNQSEYICRGMASVLGVPVEPKLIVRKVYTQTQTKLNSEERRQNVAGAFVVRRAALPRIKDGTFLLVDDVVTTGATMQACARVLIQGGAKQVIACAAALAM